MDDVSSKHGGGMGYLNSKDGGVMEYVSEDPISTGECLVQAENMNNKKDHDRVVGNNVNTETKGKNTKKVWTKLRNGLFGWRVHRPGGSKASKEKQTGAELGSAKSGTPNVKKFKLDDPAKSLSWGSNNITAGISIASKRKYSGWDNTRGGVDNERERLTDSDPD